MIPIFGYFLVRAKCIHCYKRISFRYPLFELVFAVVWGSTLFLIQQEVLSLYLLILFLLTAYIALSDLKEHEVRVDALSAFSLTLLLIHILFIGSTFYWVESITMIVIIVLSIFVVRYWKGDNSAHKNQIFLGGADWVLLLASTLLFGLTQTIFLLVVTLFLILCSQVFIKRIPKLSIQKGVPFLFWFTPLLYLLIVFVLMQPINVLLPLHF